MGLFSWLDKLSSNPQYTVKYNSDGRRGYEVNQKTFEGENAKAEAEAWVRNEAVGKPEHYKVKRTT